MSFLRTLQSRTGGGQIVIGNAGTLPESVLAPYVNGYVFECFNGNWDFAYPLGSPAQWRQSLETYLSMEKVVREPKAVILEGCGHTSFSLPDSTLKTIPIDRDIKEHRFSIGTAMLGDGFYEWDLWHNQGAPYWFDEYSVDANGTAVEDRTKKGYLGGALTDAVELAGGSTLVYQQDFENGIPASLSASPGNGVFLPQTPNQVISGKASLVISNPDHTRKAAFTANLGVRTTIALGSSALVKLKWRITQTLDGQYPRAGLRFHLSGKNPLDNWNADGVVTGDSGTVTIPVPAVDSSDLTLSLDLSGGGGEAAIDDIQIYQGGVGPWRRDFENGFVLVNPFNQPHTFSAAELAGTLNRSGIKTIKGTQAPDVNNGQPVTGDLTLGAFDAVVLLADPIRFNPPAITGIANAASGQPGVASGAFVSIYGLNCSTRAWRPAGFPTIERMPG